MPSSARKTLRVCQIGLVMAALIHSPLVTSQCAPDPTVLGGTVSCAGIDANGFVTAFDGVTVNVTGTVASPLAFGSSAVRLTGNNVVVQLTGSGSVTAGFLTSGVSLDGDGGFVSIGSSASITQTSVGAGISLVGNGSEILIDGAVNGSGFFGHGILSLNTTGTQVTVSQTGSVTTTGDDARAIDLQASNSTIIVAGTVTTSGGQTLGDAAHALIIGDSNFGTSGGLIDLLGTAQVTTSADGAGAVLAQGNGPVIRIAAGATVNANGEVGPINTFPSFGVGSDAVNGTTDNAGTISANPATGSIGALLAGNNSVFNNNPSGIINGGGIVPGMVTAFAFIGAAGDVATLNNFGSISGNIMGFGESDTVVNNTGGGTVTGNVVLGTGDDLVNTANTITGDVGLDDGSDELIMAAGNNVGGGLDGGDDTSTADGFIDLLRIGGGSRTVTPGTFTNWEIVQLSGTTNLSIDSPALQVGGDPGTDPGSALNYGLNIQDQAVVSLLQSVAMDGNITNDASLQLTADNSAGTLLTLAGHYTGTSGELVLDVVLGDDSSPADILVVSPGGSITGTTQLAIRNLGGMGDATTGDGILVVETVGNATSTADAFTLAGPLGTGDFQYELFFGGLNDPDDGNWYLRSNQAIAVPALSPILLGLCCLLLGFLGVRRIRSVPF